MSEGGNRSFHLVVPGPLEQRTGGYLYDARMACELERDGWAVAVHNLEGAFPGPDAQAAENLDACLASIPDGDCAVLDGLAMGALPSVVAAHSMRITIVSLLHHPLADETGIATDAASQLHALEREGLTSVRGVIVTSAFTAERLSVAFGVDPTRVRTVLPGTEPAEAAEGPPSGAPPMLVCVGTLSERKGQTLLVEALGRLRELEWTCVLAGSPDRDRDYAARVHGAVAEASLGERIDFLGELESTALDALYHSASVFVLPSWYEGYGMALAEALARGLPVVSTTGGAIPHTVPETCGLLVPPGDVDALTAALRRVLRDGALRGSFAEAARRHARTLPTWDRQARLFGSAIREFAGVE